MNPVDLLLVEDDPVSRAFLVQALEHFPARVDAAADAAQATAFARGNEYALWLLDANLPDASGEELLRRLRALHPVTPALCLTAEVDGVRHAALARAGFAEVLLKPITIDTLAAALRRQLGSESRSIADASIFTAATAIGSAASAGNEPPVWDHAQASLALGGNLAAVRALRALFLAELPAQAQAIAGAIARQDSDAVRAELHRLKAGCGFVGSARLLVAVRALDAAPLDALCAQRFTAAVQETVRSSGCSPDTGDACA